MLLLKPYPIASCNSACAGASLEKPERPLHDLGAGPASIYTGLKLHLPLIGNCSEFARNEADFGLQLECIRAKPEQAPSLRNSRKVHRRTAIAHPFPCRKKERKGDPAAALPRRYSTFTRIIGSPNVVRVGMWARPCSTCCAWVSRCGWRYAKRVRLSNFTFWRPEFWFRVRAVGPLRQACGETRDT